MELLSVILESCFESCFWNFLKSGFVESKFGTLFLGVTEVSGFGMSFRVLCL